MILDANTNVSCYGYADIYSMDNDVNPVIVSPNTFIQLPFMQTRETLSDAETYRRFIVNCESRFRHSKTYSNYKSFLYSIGLDHCQVHGNISSEMASIEMHHNMLTLFDIIFIITEHMLNSGYCVNTFRVVQITKMEHIKHHIQLVMLTKTPHQMYHNSSNQLYIAPSMCFGNWYEFLKTYRLGISKEIAIKIITYLDKAIQDGDKTTDNNLLNMRNEILSWSRYNDINFA
jgi:hypothetical protein